MTEAVSQPISTPGSTAWTRLATEVGVARVALSAVALHIVDDAFLQPEPGMSAFDHPGGARAARSRDRRSRSSIRRLRAGARAALALVFGIFAIASGIEAAYYTLNGGPSGDDFTGWLSLAAGVVLVALGAVTLWRTRRTDDSRRRRYLRRALLVLAALVVATQVMFPLVIAQVMTHTARAHVPTPDLGAPHENVSFTTSDGLRLEGWFVPSRNGATVIVVPGPLGPAEADADARGKRLRRAALRPSR